MTPEQNVAVRIVKEILHSIKLTPGQKENEVADWIKVELKKRGAKPAFSTIVASGKRSLDPHGHPTNKFIKSGDQVVVDFGAHYKGYKSDVTRTYLVGNATGKQKRFYNIVKNAQLKAIAAVKEGVRCCDIDLIARNYIKKLCYNDCHISNKKCPGDCFIHTTGHGVGRRIHQGPKISLRNKRKLKAGQVITIEPGIYIKGWGGIRIEDMVLVTKTGGRNLTA
ncbi:MAG: M24 family metallopeptidase [Candidatus Margulisiibacteriota bacterium]